MGKEQRRRLKREAKSNLKRHYLLMVAICLFASFFGIEYGSSTMSYHMVTDEFSSTGAILNALTDEEAFEGTVDRITAGHGDEVKAEIRERKKRLRENDSSRYLGRSNGVFASLLNSYSAGSFKYAVSESLLGIFGSRNIVIAILILGSLMIYLFIWIFIKETYRVVMRRFVLEGRTYDKLTVHRFLYPMMSRSWLSIAWTMFLNALYKSLWTLTIVGGIIKYYSYSMVPYILAENPGIRGNEAITLSRKMMKGHKWELFVADLSFLGWYILGIFTMGISDIFYANPYKSFFFAEYYVQMRELAKENQISGAEKLCDEYLYRKAPEDVLERAYPEIRNILEEYEAGKSIPEPKGIPGFLAKWMGIEFRASKKVEMYERKQALQYQAQMGKEILDGDTYPGRLATFPTTFRFTPKNSFRASRCYPLVNLVIIFFVMSFVGWLWEVSIHLVEDGVFVNRGVLHGPWLPIYGAGSILVLVLLYRFREKPLLEFISIMLVCGSVEYFTSWFLQKQFNGQTWWDYSGYFLNINGRVCGEGLLVFGLGGLAIVYLLAPVLDNLIRKFSPKKVFVVALLLVCIFTADQIYSGRHPNTGAGISSGGTKTVAMIEIVDLLQG